MGDVQTISLSLACSPHISIIRISPYYSLLKISDGMMRDYSEKLRSSRKRIEQAQPRNQDGKGTQLWNQRATRTYIWKTKTQQSPPGVLCLMSSEQHRAGSTYTAIRYHRLNLSKARALTQHPSNSPVSDRHQCISSFSHSSPLPSRWQEAPL